MSGGGGSSDVEYTQSPEARQMLESIMPFVQGLSQYGQQRYFGGAPQMGAPSMQGVLTGQQMYDIPNPATAMPTNDWWNSLDPGVKQGLYAPYQEAGQQLMEQMGSKGQMGSARPGYSGAAGAAMGELAGQAANNVGLSAWNMTGPMAQNAWNADLTRNMNAYNVGQQERMGDYNTQMNVWGMPQQLFGQGSQYMPQAYVQPQSNQFGGMMGGATMGGLAGYQLGGGWGAGLGALGGGLAGYYS